MRRLIAGVGMAALLLAVVPARSSGQAAEGAGYDFVSAAGLGDGITARVVIEEFLPVEEFVSLSSVSAESRLESGRSSSLAVLPDPGDLVLTLPGTAGGLAGIPGLPDYPAAARADHPTVPRDEVSLVPDADLGALQLLAEADEASAHAKGYVTDLVDTVGLLPGFSVGSIRSESTSKRLDPLTYEVKAMTTTNDVRVGGLLRIGQLTTLVTARVEDGQVRASKEETRISGATLAGQAVGIDENGFTSPNGSQALQPVVDQLAEPLAESGYSVTVTPGEVSEGQGTATADSGTLLVEYRTKVQGTYDANFSVGLGRSTATVTAGRVVDEELVGGLDSGTDLEPGGSELAGADTGPAGVLGNSLEAPGDAVAATGTAPTGGDADTTPVSAVTDLMDFRGLYRLLAVAAVAMMAARFWALAQAGKQGPAPRPNLRAMWRW